MVTDSALITSSVDPDISAAMVVYQRIDTLKDALGLKDLSVPEMQLFAMVAHHTGLDPFTRQIYAIKRGGKVTHQTGIDGYRSAAERTKEYAGSEEATYEACDCKDPGSPDPHPALARVVVLRILPNGHVVNQTGIARWHELKPAHVKPQNAYDFLDAMWWRMPWNQLAKCAEANGLRKAFPRVLGGVYISDEMQQAEPIEGTATEMAPAPTAAERIAARAAAARVTVLPQEPAGDDTTTPVLEGDDIGAAAATPEASAPSASGSMPAPAGSRSISWQDFGALVEKHKVDDKVIRKMRDELSMPAFGKMDDAQRYMLADALGLLG